MNAQFLGTMFVFLLVCAGTTEFGAQFSRSHGYQQCSTEAVNRTSAVCPEFVSVAQTIGVGLVMGAFWVPAGLLMPSFKPGRSF